MRFVPTLRVLSIFMLAGSSAPLAAGATATREVGEAWVAASAREATGISIACGNPGEDPSHFALRALVEAHVTFYHEAMDTGGILELERYNVVHQILGDFVISGATSTEGAETILITGAAGASKYLAHGTSFHLLGLAPDGRMLDMTGNIFYGTPFEIGWGDQHFRRTCEVEFLRRADEPQGAPTASAPAAPR